MSILRLREKLTVILSIKDSPMKISLSFGIGIFIGMSPLLGFHTILGIAIAWLFNLNKLVTIVGVYITNPWTIVPIYTFSTWVGTKMTGLDMAFSNMNWNHVTILSVFKFMGSLLWPFILGTLLVGTLSGIVGFFLIYYSVRLYGYKKIS